MLATKKTKKKNQFFFLLLFFLLLLLLFFFFFTRVDHLIFWIVMCGKKCNFEINVTFL